MQDVKVETQTIPQGPVASQVAIKMLGTNGGGFFNANAAHPFENPTPLSNFIQILSIFLIPAGLTYFLGRSVGNQKHGWSVWSAMFLLFLVGVLVCWYAEAHGNPRLTVLGIDQTCGNMEGKEVRFGIFNSSLFATVTTDASCGAVIARTGRADNGEGFAARDVERHLVQHGQCPGIRRRVVTPGDVDQSQKGCWRRHALIWSQMAEEG